jgi:hypothetical protein
MANQIKEAFIDLNDFRTPGAKVFTGRDRGRIVRNKSKIDSLESKFERINVIVPNDIYAINPSFLEEFLVNVVLKLKSDGFSEKFNFECQGDYKIDNDLEEAVDRILREENALII